MLKLMKAILVLVLATLLGFVFQELGFKDENILMIYVVGVLMIIIQTQSYFGGITAGIAFVVTYNFCFKQPKYTLHVDDPNYFVSVAVFLLVAVIVGTLTTRLQKQIKIAEYNEKVTAKLYKVSHGFINLTSIDAIIEYTEQSLIEITDREVQVYIKTDDFNFKRAPLWWTYNHGLPCGKGEEIFPEINYKCLPIKSRDKTLGVAVFSCDKNNMVEEELNYANTILSQMTIALERRWFNNMEEQNRIKIAKEQLKNNLLRSISHDLRTPLTGITGGASFLKESLDQIDQETAETVLEDIIQDSSWLSRMVENLLNMTRIQEGRLTLNTQKEVIDDIISEASIRVSTRLKEHTLTTDTPEEILLANIDAQLIIQVLVNLIDNAITHTKAGTHINIRYYQDAHNIVLEVEDNGGGIDEEKLEKIFENFYTTAQAGDDKQRGIGLGLSICQSIVQAHQGTITAKNNEQGGATFKVTLPMEGV